MVLLICIVMAPYRMRPYADYEDGEKSVCLLAFLLGCLPVCVCYTVPPCLRICFSCLSLYLSVCLLLRLLACLPAYLLSAYLSARVSACASLPASLSACPSIYQPHHVSASLSLCITACTHLPKCISACFLCLLMPIWLQFKVV